VKGIATKPFIAAFYGVSMVASLFMGQLYLLSSEFMPYHADALSLEWGEVSPELKVLLLALMRVAGGGFLCVGIVLAFLLFFPFREDRIWARITLPLVIFSVYVPTLYATISVTLNSPATAPWYGPAAAVLCALVGAICDFFRQRKSPNQPA